MKNLIFWLPFMHSNKSETLKIGASFSSPTMRNKEHDFFCTFCISRISQGESTRNGGFVRSFFISFLLFGCRGRGRWINKGGHLLEMVVENTTQIQLWGYSTVAITPPRLQEGLFNLKDNNVNCSMCMCVCRRCDVAIAKKEMFQRNAALFKVYFNFQKLLLKFQGIHDISKTSYNLRTWVLNNF